MPSFLLHIPSISEILHLYKEDVRMEIYSWVSSLFLSGGGQTLTSRGGFVQSLGPRSLAGQAPHLCLQAGRPAARISGVSRTPISVERVTCR